MRFIIIFLSLSTLIFANDDLARRYYLNKDYKKAKVEYQKLIQKNPLNSAYLYNLGSVYYRLNQTNQAKFYYLKALKLQPSLIDAQANVNLINASIIDQTLIQNTFFTSVLGVSFKGLSVIGFLSTLIIMLLFLGLKNSKPIFKRLIIISAIITFPLSVILFALHLKQPQYAMIFDSKVTVYSGPSITQKTLFYIHDGVDFKLTKESESWANITFSNGLSGWIELKYVHRI